MGFLALEVEQQGLLETVAELEFPNQAYSPGMFLVKEQPMLQPDWVRVWLALWTALH